MPVDCLDNRPVFKPGAIERPKTVADLGAQNMSEMLGLLAGQDKPLPFDLVRFDYEICDCDIDRAFLRDRSVISARPPGSA